MAPMLTVMKVHAIAVNDLDERLVFVAGVGYRKQNFPTAVRHSCGKAKNLPSTGPALVESHLPSTRAHGQASLGFATAFPSTRGWQPFSETCAKSLKSLAHKSWWWTSPSTMLWPNMSAARHIRFPVGYEVFPSRPEGQPEVHHHQSSLLSHSFFKTMSKIQFMATNLNDSLTLFKLKPFSSSAKGLFLEAVYSQSMKLRIKSRS